MPCLDTSSQKFDSDLDNCPPPYAEYEMENVWATAERRWLVDQLYILYYKFRRVFGSASATTWTVDGWTDSELCSDSLTKKEEPEMNTLGLLLPQWEGWYYSPERLVPERVPLPNQPRLTNRMQFSLPVRPIEWLNKPSWADSDLLLVLSPVAQENLSRSLRELDESIIRKTTSQRVSQYAAKILREGIVQARKDIEDAKPQNERDRRRISASDAVSHSNDASGEARAEHVTLNQEACDQEWRIRLLRLRLDWLVRWEKEDAKYRSIFRRNRIKNAERIVSPKIVADAEDLILDSLVARTTYDRSKCPWDLTVLYMGEDRNEYWSREKKDSAIGQIILGQWYRNALVLCGLLPEELKQIEEKNGGIIPDIVPIRAHVDIPELKVQSILLELANHPLFPLREIHPLLSINPNFIRDQRWAAIASRKAERA